MSIAMPTTRPSLPSFASLAVTNSTNPSDRKLPPLSSLFNEESSESITSESTKQPVSPIHGSTDLSSHHITSFPTPASIKKPIRLPSFDSLKFDEKKSLEEPLTLLKGQNLQRSKSFSLPTSTPLSQSGSIKLSPILSKEPHPLLPQLQTADDSPLVEKRAYAFISHSPSTYPSQEPAIDNAQLARRKRRRTTPRELAILQEEFERGSTPNRVRRNQIAKSVDMTEKAVQIWFQNRRQTLRKQSNAEKEVHHIEPIYLHHQMSSNVGTPVRNQPIIFSNQPYVVQQQQQQPQPQPPLQSQGSSSPLNSSSPSSISASRIEESNSPTKTPSVQSLLVTPSRTTRSGKTSPLAGSTLTFRLTKNNGTQISSTASSESLPSTANNEKTMTPVKQQQRPRQKPMMKVNPTPPRINSSPLLGNKENLSPLKNKSNNESDQKIKAREPLKELNFNSDNKPKEEKGNEKECVANLLNLRNWR